tara:strand:+ start:412 stop:909 length:498 start_codon:yes stop_codon:yes gene_type:complete
MAEQNQIIVKPIVESGASKGSRKQVNLISCFAASPIYTGDMNDDERKKLYAQLALEGVVVNGNGVNSFDRDFSDAPNLEDVDLSTHNLPSPFMPNPTSPGPGSLNAADKPAYTGTVPDMDFNVEFGSGKGGTVSPSETAKEISKQSVHLSSYISGRSYAGSDGQA